MKKHRPTDDASQEPRRAGSYRAHLLTSAFLVLVPALGAAEQQDSAPANPTPATATAPAAPTPGNVAPVAADAEARKTWLRNRIRWSTASEVDNFGYDIFRGLDEKGPFTKVNAKPVLGSGTTDEPQKYEYYDDTIEAGTVYWYYVESISIDGEREIFTPVFQAKPKFPPEEKPADPPSEKPAG